MFISRLLLDTITALERDQYEVLWSRVHTTLLHVDYKI